MICLLVVAAGCGTRPSGTSSPKFRTDVATMQVELNEAGESCYRFSALEPLGASSELSFCKPFYDRQLVLMALSAGPNRPEKALVGMMPYTSTRFNVGLSDGGVLETESDTEGFFALRIATEAQIEEVVILPVGKPQILCKPVDIDSVPCR
jgi:hypothetical protein